MALLIPRAGFAQDVKTKPDQNPPAEAEEETAPQSAPGAGAPYRGVAPGAAKVLPPHAPRKKTPLRVTWTGFQMKPDGGSRVFVELTSEAQYQVTDVAKGVDVTIKGARLHLRNNGRPLDTRFFASPVKSVHASEKRGEVTIHIETKGKAVHNEHLEPQGGYQFLLIDFSEGAQASTNHE